MMGLLNQQTELGGHHLVVYVPSGHLAVCWGNLSVEIDDDLATKHGAFP